MHALREVPGLRAGDGRVRETPPVLSLSRVQLEATLKHLSSVTRAMVLLQLHTAMRPGEVTELRGRDLDRSGETWCYRPTHHKTAHLGFKREIWIGPNGREVLAPFLKFDPDAPLFSPREAQVEVRKSRRLARKTKVQPSQVARAQASRKNPGRKPGESYTVDSYRRAIHRACVEAGIPRWSPNRLRHSGGTLIRSKLTAEAAQAVMGHKHLRTTELYAEKSQALARETMENVG